MGERAINDSLEMTFKCNLKKLRITANLTISDVAHGIGLSPGHYHNLENVNKKLLPSFNTLKRISAYYNIAVSDLFNPITNN